MTASDFTLAQLRAFLAVAETLNFRSAAQRLHISQPPLSRQIQALESSLCARLLDRNRAGVALTAAGRQFRDDAEAIVQLVEAAQSRVSSLAGIGKSDFRVGYVDPCALDLLPQVISRFNREFPHIELELQEMNSRLAEEQLELGSLDFAFLRPPITSPHLEVEIFRQEPLVLALPANRPPADVVNLADFADEKFVCYSRNVGSGVHSSTLRACSDAGFTPQIVQRVSSTASVMGLVADGVGIALVAYQYALTAHRGVRFARLADEAAHTFLALARRAGYQDTVFDRLLALATEGVPVVLGESRADMAG